MKNLIILIIIAFLLPGCRSGENKTNDLPDVLAVNMDTTTAASQDFFQYANGAWIKSNEIPNEQSEWGMGNLVTEENLVRLRTINENAAKENAEKGSVSQKIGDFWKTAMDSDKVEATGTKPLQPYLDRINQV